MQGDCGGALPHIGTAARETGAPRQSLASPLDDRETHKPHRFLLAAAAGARDPGHSDPQLGAKAPDRPLGEGFRNFV
jgi:hypothetical protein